MTTYDKATLATYFQTGDVPTGSDYANLIESQVNLAETSSQEMIGSLVTTELITPRVSATNVVITGTLSANAFSINSLTATSINATTVSASNIHADNYGTVSANALNVTGSARFLGPVNVSGSFQVSGNTTLQTTTVTKTLTMSGPLSFDTNSSFNPAEGSASVSASGTTQATAALLPFNPVILCTGIVNGSTTGFRLASNSTGYAQWISNPATSANLWPPVGGSINNLGANNVYPLAAGSLTTVIYVGASSYAASS